MPQKSVFCGWNADMRFITAIHTDIGIKKKTNQDSVLLLEADTDYGRVVLACVCDGMGGLAKGEVASAALVRAYSDWFYNSFPAILYSGCKPEDVRSGLEQILQDMGKKIMNYGRSCGVSLGSTAVALLICGNRYYVSNVGDSRCYLISDGLHQITKDQTFIQREIDCGRLTPEEAAVHPQRNVLLQCIGASDFIAPDFFEGEYVPGQAFLLCSDGFRHLVSSEEFYNVLEPSKLTDEERIKAVLTDLTELNKSRREEDNISSLVVKTEQEN